MAITRTSMVDDDGSGTVGTIINNAWKTELYNQIDGIGTLIGYTPTWTAGAAAIGNGALTGYYARVGNLVYVQLYLLVGSTTNLGSGGWVFSLPIAMPNSANSAPLAGGLCFIGGAYSVTGAYMVAATSINPFAGHVGTAGVAMDATHPVAWTTGSWLNYHVLYTA